VIDKITDGIISLTGARKKKAGSEGLLHRHGDYAVWRVMVDEKDIESGNTVRDTLVKEKGVSIPAIERADAAIPYPPGEEELRGGDYLLCYGKVE
jgi:uncharacterized protein with PhoU and TrkA domain